MFRLWDVVILFWRSIGWKLIWPSGSFFFDFIVSEYGLFSELRRDWWESLLKKIVWASEFDFLWEFLTESLSLPFKEFGVTFYDYLSDDLSESGLSLNELPSLDRLQDLNAIGEAVALPCICFRAFLISLRLLIFYPDGFMELLVKQLEY